MRRKPRTFDIPIEQDQDGAAAAPGGEAPASKAESSSAEPAVGAGDEAGPVGPRPIPYAEVFDRLQRLQAEFDNFLRRTDRERLETGAHAQGLLAERLLPVLDDFDRALQAQEGGDSVETRGYALIREKLYRALADAGLERIESEGQVFDPGIHEAIMTQDVEPERDGLVIIELAPGYRFRGRMLRPARVQVGKAPDS